MNSQKRIANLLLSIFNIGRIGPFPGSIASLISVIFWYCFIPDNWIIQIVLILFVLIIGVISYRLIQEDLDERDPSYIVLDELVGMWISLILVPYRLEYFLMAFILFRYFDILKPSFIYRSQNINSSLSVFVDDILAGILTLLIMYSVIYIL